MMRWIAVSKVRGGGKEKFWHIVGENIVLGHCGREGVCNGLVQGIGYNEAE